jgi:hypothetical protein
MLGFSSVSHVGYYEHALGHNSDSSSDCDSLKTLFLLRRQRKARQRLMSLAYALPRRLLGQSEHAIGQIVDAEVRGALRDIASWPERMANPAWSENIDEDLCPPPEVGGNGDDGGGGGAVKQESAAAQRECRNSLRRERYAAKTKEI